MVTLAAKILPPTPEEIEAARRELCDRLDRAEMQPLSEKRSAEEVFAEKRVMLEELISARV